jgi:hypothetical protein
MRIVWIHRTEDDIPPLDIGEEYPQVTSFAIHNLPFELLVMEHLYVLLEQILQLGRVLSVRYSTQPTQVPEWSTQQLRTGRTVFVDMAFRKDGDAVSTHIERLLNRNTTSSSEQMVLVPEATLYEKHFKSYYTYMDEVPSIELLCKSVRLYSGGYCLPIEDTPKLTVADVSWTTLYLPLIPDEATFQGKSLHDDAWLTEFMERFLCIGKVARIDRVPRQHKELGTVQSAFVHFEWWVKNSYTQHLGFKLNSNQVWRQYGFQRDPFYHVVNGNKMTCYIQFMIGRPKQSHVEI